MINSNLAEVFEEDDLTAETSPERYYSVEFSLEGMPLSRQFKIWNIADSSMSFLVKEGSDILQRLKAGDVINMKYYSINSDAPTKLLNTEIRNITREHQGKFRGHCFVNCAIMDN